MSQIKRKIPLKVLLTTVSFLIMPTVAIVIIFITYPELSKESYIRRLCFIIPISIILITISKISIRYERGTYKRYILNVSYTIFTIIWLYGFLGGSIVISETWKDFPFFINLWKYVSLISIVAAVNILYRYLEYKVFKLELDLKKLESFLIKHEKKNKENYIDEITKNKLYNESIEYLNEKA